MRLEALRYLIPVTSQAREQPNLPPQVEEPPAGARWGRPGAFSYTVQSPDDVLASPTGPTFPTWVEIQEGGDPIKRTKHYEASVNLSFTYKSESTSSSFTTGTPGQVGYARSVILTQDTLRRIDNLSYQFTEVLPKKHIGESNPLRKWDYSLNFERVRPDD